MCDFFTLVINQKQGVAKPRKIIADRVTEPFQTEKKIIRN
jgi:hypothetical protein